MLPAVVVLEVTNLNGSHAENLIQKYDMSENLSAQEAMEKLIDGNRRFVENQLTHPHEDMQWRFSLVDKQEPYAVIVTCSDSRVAPEIVFDQGLGDLFVIRVAGNVAKDKVIGTIEYAVAHLGVNLVVVMGHESCGAVGASLEIDLPGGHINTLVHQIRPAVLAAQEMEGDVLTNAIKINAKMVARNIQDSDPYIRPKHRDGQVQVVPAYYKLSDGTVEFMD